MTTLTAPAPTSTATSRRLTAERTAAPSVSFGRLLLVECRKLVNTRAGRWLLIIALALSTAATALAVTAFEATHIFNVFMFAFLPLGMLVPVVAILASGAEWSQRTGLTTFALEPRRWRVAAAKLIATQLAAMAVMLISLAIAYAAAGLVTLTGGTWEVWSLDLATGGTALNMMFLMLQASAWAMLLLNVPAAVVVYFVLAQLWTTVVSFVPWLAERAAWIDLNHAMNPVTQAPYAATGADWLHIASAATIWVLLPLAVGLVRFMRAEVK
ncbi:MAG: hypothetical protein Q4G35_12945 [Propionibacteriaceae bacterium]|nr:hypothetical protein [Propionibacteriaceae bacterium]